MQIQLLNRIIENDLATDRLPKHTPILERTEAHSRNRKIRIAVCWPRREVCLTRRAMRAALRESEFNDWLNGGDDFVGTMHQPIA
jgi:hypothetical protein